MSSQSSSSESQLIAYDQDPTDTFADVLLDFRHHKFKFKKAFPASWLMTPEREKYLHDRRKEQALFDQRKEAKGELVDGVEVIEKAYAMMTLPAASAAASGRPGRPVRGGAAMRVRR